MDIKEEAEKKLWEIVREKLTRETLRLLGLENIYVLYERQSKKSKKD